MFTFINNISSCSLKCLFKNIAFKTLKLNTFVFPTIYETMFVGFRFLPLKFCVYKVRCILGVFNCEIYLILGVDLTVELTLELIKFLNQMSLRVQTGQYNNMKKIECGIERLTIMN